MKEFAGKVAVVTGGAGALGRAMGARFAAAGMRIVLADLDTPALPAAVDALRAQGTSAIGVPTDVSDASAVDALAGRALAAFGAIHVVANNAGVAPLGAAWEASAADWQWALGVNVMGVANGVRTFTPILMGQGEGHIVNVASVAGLVSPAGMAVYNATKHAVVALTETLHHDLVAAQSAVRCSVLCPAYFPSGIASSERVRPPALANAGAPTTNQEALHASLSRAVAAGRLSADDIALKVFEAVRDARFYVLPHPRIKAAIRARMEDILEEGAPRDPLGIRAQA